MLNGPLTQQQRDDRQNWLRNHEITHNAARERERDSRGKDAGCVGGGGIDATSYGAALCQMIAVVLAPIVFLFGAVFGVVGFLRLIGSVAESWHVLGLVASFVLGGVLVMYAVFFVLAFAWHALLYVLNRAWGGLRGVIRLALRA